MFTNLPAYCRNSESQYGIIVIKELIQLQYYSPRGRPPHSNTVLTFALLMRYTYNSTYRYLKTFLPLPSYGLLNKLKSQSFDSCKAWLSLKENSFYGEDMVVLLDEMYLQQQVKYDDRDLTGCDSELQMYKSILCFMVVS